MVWGGCSLGSDELQTLELTLEAHKQTGASVHRFGVGSHMRVELWKL